MTTPVPTEVFVHTPEKQTEIDRNTLKGIKFTADGKMTFDDEASQKPASLAPSPRPPSQ